MVGKKLFIFEFITGGGFHREEIPSSLFSEGFSMLRSIIEDFKSLNFHISTLLDERISFLAEYLKADTVQILQKHENFKKIYTTQVKDCQYCFIIGPEFSNVLFDLTRVAKSQHKKILSVGMEGIQLGSSKMKTYQFFKRHQINTPATYLIPPMQDTIDQNFILDKFEEFNGSCIIKPEDGVGADYTFLFEEKSELIHFCKNFPGEEYSNRRFIIQNYIKGKPLSISVISAPFDESSQNFPLILSINSQSLSLDASTHQFTYSGGFTPPPLLDMDYPELFEIIRTELKKMPLNEIRGYFGIDFILEGEGQIYFIELNPRLTTPYVGLRKILDCNLAQLILDAYKGILQGNFRKLNGFCSYSKLEVQYVGKNDGDILEGQLIPETLMNIPELITPLISLRASSDSAKESKRYAGFLAIASASYDLLNSRIAEITRYLEEKGFKVLSFKRP